MTGPMEPIEPDEWEQAENFASDQFNLRIMMRQLVSPEMRSADAMAKHALGDLALFAEGDVPYFMTSFDMVDKTGVEQLARQYFMIGLDHVPGVQRVIPNDLPIRNMRIEANAQSMENGIRHSSEIEVAMIDERMLVAQALIGRTATRHQPFAFKIAFRAGSLT